MGKNIILKTLLMVSIAFCSLNAQGEVDAIEAARQAKAAAEKAAATAAAATDAAIEAAAAKAAKDARADAKQAKQDKVAREAAEAAAAEEAELDATAAAAAKAAKRKMAAELGLELEDEVAVEEANVAEVEEVEDVVAKESSGYNIGFSGSLGLIQGNFFKNIPIGGSLVISTPWGFDVAGFRFGLSATVGAYPATHSSGESLTPIAVGLGGNMTLAELIFLEGHGGLVGDATGARGFAGVSLERLMKKGLNLPVNVLVGTEGFFSNDLYKGSATYWGGLAFRLDYNI